MVAVVTYKSPIRGREARVKGDADSKVLVVRAKGKDTASVHDYATGKKLGVVPADVSMVRRAGASKGSIHITKTGQKIGDFTIQNIKDFYDFNKPQFSQPLPSVPSRRFLDQPSRRDLESIKESTGRVTIQGNDFYANNIREYRYYKALKGTIERDEEFNKQIQNELGKRGLDISDADKWYEKAYKGAGRVAVVGGLYLPQSVANAIDKAAASDRAQNVRLSSKSKYAQRFKQQELGPDIIRSARKERTRAMREVPSDVAASLDPRKPENWANILLTIAPFGKAIRGGSKFSSKYVVALRNVEKVEGQLLKAEARTNKAITLARKSVKAGSNVDKNRKLLIKAGDLKQNLQASLKEVRKLKKDPRAISVINYNPLTRSAKLIKQLGKKKFYFHATSARPKDIFGKPFTKLRSEQNILRVVRRETVRPKMLKLKGIDKDIFGVVRKEKGILTGARAQNLQVKNIFLKRKTSDIDLISSDNENLAKKIKLRLKKRYGSRVTTGKFTTKMSGSEKKTTVWRVLVDGKPIVDISKKSGVPFIKAGGLRIARADYLASRKRSVIVDLKKAFRHAKDRRDLRRLTGRLFSNKGFEKKLKNPRNYFTVQAQPQSMGASRIKFNEDMMFFDLEVPTSYAYKSLGKNRVIPKVILDSAKRLGLKKKVVRRIDSMRSIKSGDRFTVFRLKARVNTFVNRKGVPKSLKRRVLLASQGNLGAKQGIALRRDLVRYIRSKPGRAFIGSRTASQIAGERELIGGAVGTRFKAPYLKLRRYDKFTIDPETKIYGRVIDIAYARARVKNPGLAQRIRAYSPRELAFRLFTKGDLSKVRRYARLIKKSKNLTPNQQAALVRFAKRMGRKVSQWKGFVGRKGGTSNQRAALMARAAARNNARYMQRYFRRKLKGPYVQPNRKRQAIAQFGRRKSEQFRREAPVVRRADGRFARQGRRVMPRIGQRVNFRVTPRAPQRPRQIPRKAVRPRTRVNPRVGKRIVPRPVIRPETRMGRTPLRTVRRPGRVPPRLPPRLRPPRPPLGILREPDMAKKRRLLALWIRRQKAVYRPSLSAIFFGIYGRVPKRITGLEVRPIVRRRFVNRRR